MNSARLVAAGAVLVATACAGTGEGRIMRFDDRLDALLPAGTRIERVADGFVWVEGPLWNAADGTLLVSDIPRNAVYQISSAGRVGLFLHPSGYSGTEPFLGREPGSNGLAFDPDGRLVLAEHGDRRIARLEANSERTVLADRYAGWRLNSPNDLVYASNGDLYFTDPPFGLPGAFDDPARELDWSGVYRLAVDGTLRLLTDEVRAPNGIALSPDEKTLHVSNADRDFPVYLAFPIQEDGHLGGPRVLFDASPMVQVHPGAPDGIEVDRNGNLFAAGPGSVFVLGADGSHLGTIEIGTATSNVAWGGEDRSVLFITAGDTVYRVRTTTRGWSPFESD